MLPAMFSIVELPCPRVERYSIDRYTKFTLNGRRFSGLFRISGNSVLVVLHRDPIRITSVWERSGFVSWYPVCLNDSLIAHNVDTDFVCLWIGGIRWNRLEISFFYDAV